MGFERGGGGVGVGDGIGESWSLLILFVVLDDDDDDDDPKAMPWTFPPSYIYMLLKRNWRQIHLRRRNDAVCKYSHCLRTMT
jgi:hypothetical protein